MVANAITRYRISRKDANNATCVQFLLGFGDEVASWSETKVVQQRQRNFSCRMKLCVVKSLMEMAEKLEKVK